MLKQMRHLILITLLSTLLFACGGGGGGGTTPDTGNNPGNPAATTETLQIFIKTTTGVGTTYLPGGISLESETEYVIRLLPDTLTTSIFDRNYSPSYARSSISPYTIDDRLFIREDIRPFEPSGSHNYTEYGIDENNSEFNGSATVLTRFTVTDPQQLGDGCWAIVGNQYIYKNNRVYDSFARRYIGGDMRQITNVTNNFRGEGTSSSVICLVTGGSLYSTNGNLFSVNFFSSQGLIIAESVPLVTSTLNNWLINIRVSAENYNDESYLRYAFDKDKMYYVRYRTTDSAIEIWTVDLATRNAEPVKIYDAVTGFPPSYFDVDDGRIVIAGSGQGNVLLLDLINGTERIFDFGVDIYGVQVLYAEL